MNIKSLYLFVLRDASKQTETQHHQLPFLDSRPCVILPYEILLSGVITLPATIVLLSAVRH